jgi:hypothetical protein
MKSLINPKIHSKLALKVSPIVVLLWTAVILPSAIAQAESTTEIDPNNGNPPKITDTNNDSTASTPQTPPVAQNIDPANAKIVIISPSDSIVLDSNSSTVVLQFPIGAQVQLKLNGSIVDPSLVGRTETDTVTGLVTQTWYGIIFAEGKNTLTAKAALNGVDLPNDEIALEVSGTPTAVKVETVETKIPADGRSTATVRGQLVDAQGNVSNRTAIVTLDTTAGEFIGVDFKPDTPGFQVQAKKGEFIATLKAATSAQTVRIRAKMQDLEAYAQMKFDTVLRKDTLLTGIVDIRIGKQGTNFFDPFSDFLPIGKDDGFEIDARSAAFATGSIGEWQFIGAYNSEYELNKDCDCNNRLFRDYQNNEKPYPIYGDSSTTEVITPSIDNVFFRLERSSPVEGAGIDYAMWGDFRTPEFSTTPQEFTSITRQLHGFKANYNLGDLQLTGFYANNVEGFQRDTISPDGTSGYYFLSRRLLIPGSENVYIELEKLDDPGVVVSRQRLYKGTDYEIDYDRGSLLFKQPILKTDIDKDGYVLERRIVTTYEFETVGETDMFGGRARYFFARGEKESWLGATYIQENKSDQDFELYGFDAFISLGKSGKIIAEYAHSNNSNEFTTGVGGSAYRFEAQGQITPSLFAKGYYRSTDTGFSNNATSSFVPGQTRYGGEIQAQVTATTNLRFQYEHQDNFGISPKPTNFLDDIFIDPTGVTTTEATPGSKVDNSLDQITAGIEQKLGDSAKINLDWIWRDREDRLTNLNGESNQLRTRFAYSITPTLTFNAINETTLSSDTDAVFSDRTGIGLDWEFTPGMSVFASQQWFTRGRYEGKSLTSIGVKSEYHPWTDATLTGKYALVGGIEGTNAAGAIGLKQNFTLAPGLKMDLSYEHTFGKFGQTSAGNQFRQPFAFGQGASALTFDSGDSYSVGIQYTDSPDFKASARWEHRSNSQGSNTVITANMSGKISPALSALLSYNQASSANQGIEDLGTTRYLRLGLAYRDPFNDSFNALVKYEYRENPAIIPETLLLGRGTGSDVHVFSAEAIYAPDWQWEFYGKFALRDSTTFLANDFIASGTTTLTQLRATYRLGYNMDLVGEARWISGPRGYDETGFLVEAGYYLTPALRISAGYTFGRVDDYDFNGSRSADGPYIGITVKLNGLWEGFGEQTVAPVQQKESLIKEKDKEQSNSNGESVEQAQDKPTTNINGESVEQTQDKPTTDSNNVPTETNVQ